MLERTEVVVPARKLPPCLMDLANALATGGLAKRRPERPDTGSLIESRRRLLGGARRGTSSRRVEATPMSQRLVAVVRGTFAR